MVDNKDFEGRRLDRRIPGRATVFIERLTASYDNTQAADVVICNSIDVSARGLRVRTDGPLSLGAILRICAEFDDVRQPFYMVGEVKWQSGATPPYSVGFALMDSEQTDILDWGKSIARQLER